MVPVDKKHTVEISEDDVALAAQHLAALAPGGSRLDIVRALRATGLTLGQAVAAVQVAQERQESKS